MLWDTVWDEETGTVKRVRNAVTFEEARRVPKKYKWIGGVRPGPKESR